jgi:cytochrome c556
MRFLGTAISAVALGMAAALAPVGISVAGEGGDAITERKALMRLQGAAAGAIKAAIDSKDPARLKLVEGSARALAFSSRAIPTMFPKGSDSKAGETKALDKIWADPAGFKGAADNMGKLAAALADALKSGDPAASLAAFGALGKDGCGGCHGSYQRQQ